MALYYKCFPRCAYLWLNLMVFVATEVLSIYTDSLYLLNLSHRHLLYEQGGISWQNFSVCFLPLRIWASPSSSSNFNAVLKVGNKTNCFSWKIAYSAVVQFMEGEDTLCMLTPPYLSTPAFSNQTSLCWVGILELYPSWLLLQTFHSPYKGQDSRADKAQQEWWSWRYIQNVQSLHLSTHRKQTSYDAK